MNLSKCDICPRKCGVNREKGELGFCKMKDKIKIARYFLHYWEEPIISGETGSGTIFFSGCNLKCIFCQNYKISSENMGKEISVERLKEICLELQNMGANNINLVTGTHFLPLIKEALILAKKEGLTIPIVYNTSSYENVESLKEMEGLIDIYLPDLKYYDNKLAENFSLANNYFEIATNAIKEMVRHTGKPVLDRKRELEKIAVLKSMASDEFYAHSIEELFEQIMSMSRKLQYKLLTEEGINNDIGFDIISKLPMENVKVVYQGIDGAYSQQAAMSYFGDNATYHNVLTFKQAMKEVRDGVADYAVLPFENSTAGIVTDVYDLLVEFENYIVDSFDVKISHCLSAVKGTTLETIKEVYSHPQALMQSSKFIDEYGWNKVNCANTAIAAQIISQEKDNTRACIASKNAAKLYGLEVLAEDVNQSSINTTKFIIVSRRKIARREANNICISFEMPHESGSLYTMLSHIIYNDLNMTRIESRPVPGKKWEYRFYVEFEGKSDQPGVVNALSGINAEALNMQILGNY